MLKVVQIVPVMKSAITIQAKAIIKHNKDIEIKLATLHPKRPDGSEINNIRKLLQWADILDVQYWKSGVKLREVLPDEYKNAKKILTHYNPYNLHEEKWEEFQKVIVVNSFQAKELPDAITIPLAIDLDLFRFKKLYTIDPIIHMSVSRIEGKKGVEEVAQACNELGYKFNLIGRVSDGEYLKRVKKAGGEHIQFRQDVSDSQLRDSYYESAIHVCNSVDNFESGTLPVLEAMACGIPVLSRNVGHVPDLNNGENMRILEGPQHDIEGLKFALQDMMAGRNTRIKIRNNAVETVASRSDKIRAAKYAEVYKSL